MKNRYEIDLEAHRPVPAASVATRQLSALDRNELAHLILEAYRNTIDYEGETIVEAGYAIDEWLDESPLLSHSYAAVEDGEIVSATLVANLDSEPFISIVMTRPAYKRRGFGTAAVAATIDSLSFAGHSRVALYITEGNIASEALFTGLGAHRVSGSP